MNLVMWNKPGLKTGSDLHDRNLLGHTIEIAGVPRRSRVHTLHDQQ